MRMWMVKPELMCDKHLLGEHAECHMFVGHLLRHRRIDNYIRFNLLEPKSLRRRHDLLAAEMLNRQMRHKSPLPEYDLSYLPGRQKLYTVDKKASLDELLRRCRNCRKRGHL